MKLNLGKYELTTKIALVTGAAGLLGCQNAKALLDAGASVVLTDINLTSLDSVTLSLAEIYGSDRVFAKVMDVGESKDISRVYEELCTENKYVDILINNAAIDPKVDSKTVIENSSRLENLGIDSWDLQLKVGLTGAFLCSQRFGSCMANRGGGVILNIASDLSIISPDQRLYRVDGVPEEFQAIKPITYSVIKSGLIGLTRYISTYWADKGVRCNAVSPGGIFNGQNPDFVSKISNLIPMGRMAELDEYVGTIQYMCSDASKYLTGQNIVVDGGRSVW